MFETEQQKRYRTFDGQPVHTTFVQSLIRDPVLQGGLLVTAFTAAVTAHGDLTRAAVTLGGGIAGTVLPVLFSRWLLARDMRDHFNDQSSNVIDTQPEGGKPVVYESVHDISKEFHATAMTRLRVGALSAFFAAEPITRVMNGLAERSDMFMACFALAFMVSQWRLIDLHKRVENGTARIVRTPKPEKN